MDGMSHADTKRRLRYLVEEMKFRLLEADSWDQIHEVHQLQAEAEQLALALRFPGAPLKLERRRQDEPEFEVVVGVNPDQLVEVMSFTQHDPLGSTWVGVIGGLRNCTIAGKPGLVSVPLVPFEFWREGIVRCLDAWVRAIDGMRPPDDRPFRYPRAQDLYAALLATSHACGFYAAVLGFVLEPIEGDVAASETQEHDYVPPEPCLPPGLPELLERRIAWEDRRSALERKHREMFRRLDLYFTARQDADVAAEQCQLAADAAAGELHNDNLPALSQTASRVRAALNAMRERVQPWHSLTHSLSAKGPQLLPDDPSAEAEAINELIQRLRLVAEEIRPAAEQRTQLGVCDQLSDEDVAPGSADDQDRPDRRRAPENPTRPVSMAQAARAGWFGKLDPRTLLRYVNEGTWAGKKVGKKLWVFDLSEVYEHAREDARPRPPDS